MPKYRSRFAEYKFSDNLLPTFSGDLKNKQQLLLKVLSKGSSMASFNRVIMMGNLTRDPERKQLSTGNSVCRLGLASNRQFKNKTGALTQEVCFVDVEVWGAQADNCQQYLQKGKPVLIEGRLKLDSWEDNTGVKRSKHLIVADRVTFLGTSTAQSDEAGSGEESTDSFSAYDQASETVMGTEAKKKSRDVVKPRESFTQEAPFQNQSFTTNIGEIDFKAEQPFNDELPF